MMACIVCVGIEPIVFLVCLLLIPFGKTICNRIKYHCLNRFCKCKDKCHCDCHDAKAKAKE